MIDSMNTVATVTRWLSGSVLALAIEVLPFGIAYVLEQHARRHRQSIRKRDSPDRSRIIQTRGRIPDANRWHAL